MLKSMLTSAFILTAAIAQASTIDEANQPGGAFSNNPVAPTAIDTTGVTRIIGTGNFGVFDNLMLTGLAAGAQTLIFDFAAPAGSGFSYAAGAQLLFSTSPFAGSFSGITFGFVNTAFIGQSDSAALTLDAGFSGPLYVALNFTYGNDLEYTINLPAIAPPPAPVPLPATGLLLLALLGGFGLFARGRDHVSAA